MRPRLKRRAMLTHRAMPFANNVIAHSQGKNEVSIYAILNAHLMGDAFRMLCSNDAK